MKLYDELADWWPLLSHVDDYAEEAGIFAAILAKHHPGARSLLELGCGGGNNAFYLKQHYEVTLTDLSAAMISESRKINPECEHFPADMRTVDLKRTFDLVFIHDAIMYICDEADLRNVGKAAALHLNDNGVLLIVPDSIKETYKNYTSHGGHDGKDRSLRYLEWVTDQDPLDTQIEVEYVYMLREGKKEIRIEQDRAVCGVFDRSTWTKVLEESGFNVTFEPIDHSEVETNSYTGIVAVKS